MRGFTIRMSRCYISHMKYGEKAIEKAVLEVWENPSRERNYEIHISFPEFTCLCPRSGYPDFATIDIVYVPGKHIVELKSVKLYLNSFRGVYISHEEVTNRIGDFNPRGNVKTVVRVSSEGDRLPRKKTQRRRKSAITATD
jgi:7-cyano-7-deazaguanine reductase